jgi:putative DNA primase/helicase
MHAAGLDYAGPIHPDGKLHRIKVAGDRARNSWYLLFPGPPVAGCFGCWRRGCKERWCDAHRDRVSQADWEAIRRRWQDAEKEREKSEAERHAKAAKVAAWILRRSKPAGIGHLYLVAKAVKPTGDLRQYRGALVLPLRDADGRLHSLQFIGPHGTKRFLSGGRVAGCFFMVADKPDGSLIIGEGFATVASIAEATGLATVAAMNC